MSEDSGIMEAAKIIVEQRKAGKSVEECKRLLRESNFDDNKIDTIVSKSNQLMSGSAEPKPFVKAMEIPAEPPSKPEPKPASTEDLRKEIYSEPMEKPVPRREQRFHREEEPEQEEYDPRQPSGVLSIKPKKYEDKPPEKPKQILQEKTEVKASEVKIKPEPVESKGTSFSVKSIAAGKFIVLTTVIGLIIGIILGIIGFVTGNTLELVASFSGMLPMLTDFMDSAMANLILTIVIGIAGGIITGVIIILVYNNLIGKKGGIKVRLEES
ncbi:MAG: hypothetical protein ABH821_05380 [archaeon]